MVMPSLTCNGCNHPVPAHEDITHLDACEWHEFGNGWRRCTHEAAECFRAATGEAA